MLHVKLPYFKEHSSSSMPLVHLTLLCLILLIASWLRLYQLDFQSFWLDEILTILTITKGEGYSKLLWILKYEDQHPPLYFVLLKAWLDVFGYTDFNSRLLSALIGIAGVLSTYLLGHVIGGKRLGLIAAFLIAINPHHIYYSQEVRNYILLYFFAALSFYACFRLIKQVSYVNAIIFSFLALGLLHTHYYSLFIFFSEVVLLVMVGVYSIYQRAFKQLVVFGFSGLLILIGYLPWIGALRNLTGITSFWIPKPAKEFYFELFQTFFSYPNIVFQVYLILLIYFAIRLFSHQEKKSKLEGKLWMYVVLVLWFFISVIIPFDRSILSTPMLITRYLMGTLPACILMVSIAIHDVKSTVVKVFTLMFGGSTYFECNNYRKCLLYNSSKTAIQRGFFLFKRALQRRASSGECKRGVWVLFQANQFSTSCRKL